MQRPLRYQAARNAAAEELHRKIGQWATTEMCFSPDDLPSDAELKMFLSKANMDAWLYITEHIRSPRTTEVLRGNLLLQSASCGDVVVGGRDSEEAKQMDRRLQLQQEISSTQVAISQLEKDISRLRADISQTEVNNEMLREGARELATKAFLTTAHTVKCAENVQIAKEFSSRILSRPQLFRYNACETTYFARRTDAGVSGTAAKQSVTLESACTKQLRSVCGQMESLVRLHANPSTHSDEMDGLREKVWSQLEQVVSAHSPTDIVDSLAQLTTCSAEVVRDLTSAIDLQRDSQELQYRFVGGEVKCDMEEGEESSLLRSVHDHIQGLQLDHIQRAVRSEVAKRNTTTLQERAASLKAGLDDMVIKSAGPVAELVRANLHLDLEHAGCEVAMETMRVACIGLREAKEKCTSVLASLQKKHDQIREFTQLSESKQALIQCLVKHNSGARQQLCDQQTKLVLYTKQNVCAHEVELLRLVASLSNNVSRELTLFSSLSSSRLLTLHKPGTSVGDLSISLLKTMSSLHSVLSTLRVPTYSSTDQVLVKVMKMLDKAEALHTDLEETKHELKELRASQAIQVNVNDVVAKVERYNTSRVEEKLPQLQSCMLSVSKTLARCVQVQQALDEWWEQPSQCLTPWITYEGMDVARWIEQWDCLATKLRQLTSTV